MSKIIRRYSELIRLPTFRERFMYLRLDGIVGAETFGYDRLLNQMFYTSGEWRSFRKDMIIRDGACDLAMPGYELDRDITLHHLVPVSKEDILKRSGFLMDPEFVVCCSPKTHRAIHYGDEKLLAVGFEERSHGDTCPWKRF